MNNAELELSKAMDQDAQAQNDAENEQASEGVQERLRTSGLDVTGPSSEDYDYVGADRAGTPFTPIDTGGVNLPNKFNQNRYVAGRRVSDGMKVHSRNDPNGFGAEGFKRLQGSYINTETGAPPEAMDSTMLLMAEHVQNGGTLEDFDDPTGMASDAHQTLKATSAIQAIAHELRSLPPSEDVAPVADAPALTLEDVVLDPQFIAAGRVLRDHFGMDDTKSEMQAGRPVPGTEEKVEVGDEEIAEDMIEEIAATFSSAWKMGALIYAIESGDMSPDTQAAYAYAFDVYDKISMWNPDVLKGTARGIGMDVPLYAAGGGIGTAIAKSAAKTTMVKHVMSRLAAHKLATGAGVGAAVGAVESGGFGMAEEATRQKVSGQDNMDKVWNTGANQALVGAMFMTPFGALLSKPGRDFVKRAYHSIADNVGRAKTPMNAKEDWVPVSGSETHKDNPVTLADMGVPMADSAGTEYYSRLYRTAVEDGLISNKETNPLQYLKVLKKRMAMGRFKVYELQESRLEEFLQGKADTSESVNKDMVDDFLWANRPRVHFTVSSEFDFTAPGSESTRFTESPTFQRRAAASTAFKNNVFEVEEVVDAQGRTAAKVTNTRTGIVEVTDSPEIFIINQTQAMLKGMTDDEVVNVVRTFDNEAMLGPPRYGKDVGGKGSPTIIKGVNANNYKEFKLMLPYGGMDNVDDIAMDRFGDTFDNLTERAKKRVLRIKDFSAERRPGESYRHPQHYPLDHNRLAMVRTQELFQPQNGGQRVLAVNEIQSDMYQTLKQSDKDTDGGNIIMEDSAGNEIKQPEQQATAGWLEMTVNRTLQLAEQQGYNKVAFPVDPDMIQSIQLWRDKDISQGVLDFHRILAKMIKKDKRLAKTWGIESVQLEDVAAAPDGGVVPQQMMVITFDPTKNKGPKPIYGIGVTSGAGGTLSIDAKSEDE